MQEKIAIRVFLKSCKIQILKTMLAFRYKQTYNHFTHLQVWLFKSISFLRLMHKVHKQERSSMDYKEFVCAMKKEVGECVRPGVTVELHHAVKNNGTHRQGLLLIESGINISPAIYLEEFYEQYQRGKTVPVLAETICTLYEKVKIRHSYPCENIMSYNKIKDRIVFKLISAKDNREILGNVPHKRYLRFAVVYYVLIEDDVFGTATLLIRYEHLRSWGVTQEQIMKAAEENTPRLFPARLDQLADQMYVLTNQKRNLGAGTVCYPGCLKEAWEEIGENYYVIPSSIHEMILIPESCGIERCHLEHMLREINEKEVEEEEVLSDYVYYYNGEKETME